MFNQYDCSVYRSQVGVIFSSSFGGIMYRGPTEPILEQSKLRMFRWHFENFRSLSGIKDSLL
jgi:hypothetical protein